MSNHTILPLPGRVLVASSIPNYVLVALGAFCVYILGAYLTSPVRHYPGPLLASNQLHRCHP